MDELRVAATFETERIEYEQRLQSIPACQPCDQNHRAAETRCIILDAGTIFALARYSKAGPVQWEAAERIGWLVAGPGLAPGGVARCELQLVLGAFGQWEKYLTATPAATGAIG